MLWVVNFYWNMFILYNLVINLIFYKKIFEGIYSDFGNGERIRWSNDGKRKIVVFFFYREFVFNDSGEKEDLERRCFKWEK